MKYSMINDKHLLYKVKAKAESYYTIIYNTITFML